ncbi:MAG: hypothetical protein QOJ94_1165, partial [Sphingomonadales bacterium]|nr:hypothetical protein [Sphingomonadales bacterium]
MSRRGRLAAALLAAACVSFAAAGPVRAADSPKLQALEPGTPPPWTPGYQPLDKDEKGLWMEADEAERTLKASNFVVHDEALNAYIKSVL